MSVRDRGRAAEMRAERVRWRGRSHSMSQASRNMSERLRRMNVRASALDMRLRRHAEKSANWHEKWDGPPRLG
jgi:predicted nuclease with TOPRIM domain